MALGSLFTWRTVVTAATYAAPTLTILSNAVTSEPVFSIDVDAAFTAGHSIVIERDTSSSFTTATSSTRTLNYTEISDAEVSHGLGSSANGTWYFRAKHVYGSNFSDWSDTVSITLAAPSEPTAIAYVAGGTGTRYVSSGPPTSMFFDGIAIPAVSTVASRYIIVAMNNSLTVEDVRYLRVDLHDGIGPRDMTLVDSTYEGTATSRQLSIWAVEANTGSYADIEVIGPGQIFDTEIIVGAVYKMAALPATEVQKSGIYAGADPLTTAAVTIPASAICFAAMRADGSATTTWNNSFVETTTAYASANRNTCEIAIRTTTGSATPSVTRGNLKNSALIAAVLSQAA